MPDFPTFDGRQELTKETMNDVVRSLRRQRHQWVAPGLEQYDLGSAGRVISLSSPVTTTTAATTTAVSYSQSGFWARVYASGPGGGLPAAPSYAPPAPGNVKPYAWFIEQFAVPVPTAPGATPDLSFADNPDGRKGLVEHFNGLFQGVGNLTSSRAAVPYAYEIALAGYTGGSFTLSMLVGSILSTSPAVSWPPTLASVKSAVESLVTSPTGTVQVTEGPSGTLPSGTGEGYSYLVTLTPASGVTGAISLFANLGGLTGGGQSLSGPQTLYRPGGDLLNLDPHGTLAFVVSFTAQDDTTHYLFQLPYTGMMGRITGVNAAVKPPRYTFIEQLIFSGTGGMADNTSGLTGDAYEVSGEPGVPVNSTVWLTPLFKPGAGFFYFFQAPADVRILKFTGGANAPNCIIPFGRAADAVGQAAQVPPGSGLPSASYPCAAHMVLPDGNPGNYAVGGYYLGQRAGTTGGFARFLAPDSIGSGYTGSVGAGDIPVVNGLVQPP